MTAQKRLALWACRLLSNIREQAGARRQPGHRGRVREQIGQNLRVNPCSTRYPTHYYHYGFVAKPKSDGLLAPFYATG
jgi:hypothetical protein